MMQNDDDDQELSDDHPMKAYKHSYFLRTKAPRLGFEAHDEDGDYHRFKKPFTLARASSSARSARNEEFTNSSEEEDLANCLVMLSNRTQRNEHDHEPAATTHRVVAEKGLFQCKACKKVFNSHQALGGHRASHKKVKGCFASRVDEDENLEVEEPVLEDQEPAEESRPTKKKAKMHECSVCRRVFASGQALGGHKRCHWLTTAGDNAFIPSFQDFQLCKKPVFGNEHELELEHDLDLNLNLPPAKPSDGKQGEVNHHGGDTNLENGSSTRLCLQKWSDQNQDCGRKLSDLRDVNLDGGWLQMGIPSTSEMR